MIINNILGVKTKDTGLRLCATVINGETWEALYDADVRYRYILARHWGIDDDDLPIEPVGINTKPLELDSIIAFIGLNPSTATELKNDNTVSRCIKFAKRWEYTGMVMLNIFAFRSTDPNAMKAAGDPVGQFNTYHLLSAAKKCNRVVCAWGNHGDYMNRGNEIARMLTVNEVEMFCLDVNKTGSPKHPLYCRDDSRLKRYYHDN